VAKYNQLEHANNPSDLNSAAGVASSWDSKNNRWNIELDVTQMAGEGVIVIDDDTGNFDHLGELIGQSLTPTANGDGAIEFPAMSVSQVGTTVRLYEDSNGVATWAPENSRSLFWDALTDREGKIYIDGVVVLDLFGDGAGCDGTDSESFDSDSVTGLDGEQCSTADTHLSPGLPEKSCTEDFGRENCFLLVDNAQTVLETGYTNYFSSASPRFRCAITPNTSPGECDTTSSGGFTRVRQVADSMEIDSDVFKSGTLEASPPAVSGNSVNELVFGSSEGNGVCSAGTADRSSYSLPTLRTRDGSYDVLDPGCSF
jgi:hypothetical protein